jgi:hypothetical protein
MFRSVDHHQGTHLSQAKVTIAKMFCKIRRYELSGGVAAYYVKSIVVCMLCVVRDGSLILHYTKLEHRYGLDVICWHTTP